MSNHDRFIQVFKNRAGQIFRTRDIVSLMLNESDIELGSILPNDHAKGNKSDCWCAGTQARIFDQIKRGLYQVRKEIGEDNTAVESQREPIGAAAEIEPRIAALWHCQDESSWKTALSEYWNCVKPCNRVIEEQLNNLNVSTASDIEDWYSFLLCKYIPWKYTNFLQRKRTEARIIKAYASDRQKLRGIVAQLFCFNHHDIHEGLTLANKIAGIGVAGASGLLAILFPESFGTVDRFVVAGLSRIKNLPQAGRLQSMNPKKTLRISDGVLLIEIMREKARELNSLFVTDFWTPRKIDMILWAIRD